MSDCQERSFLQTSQTKESVIQTESKVDVGDCSRDVYNITIPNEKL